MGKLITILEYLKKAHQKRKKKKKEKENNVLEFYKLEYLKKVVVCYIFSKQCNFEINFVKM